MNLSADYILFIDISLLDKKSSYNLHFVKLRDARERFESLLDWYEKMNITYSLRLYSKRSGQILRSVVNNKTFAY